MSLHHRAPNAEKGARYLGLLDHALCHGQWNDVPELARKVEKHAPERKCFTLVARAECQVVSSSHRPTSASSETSTSIHGLSQLVPRLDEAAASAGTTYPDDATTARTCLAGIYWLQEAHKDAIKVLAASPKASSIQGGKGAAPLGWLEVCHVKAAYIHVTCLEASGKQADARDYYRAAVLRAPGYRTPELRRWTERLLAKACLFSLKSAPSSAPSLQYLRETYVIFKAWSDFWERAPSTETFVPGNVDVPRRRKIWYAYYDLLSTILEMGFVLNPAARSNDDLFIPSDAVMQNDEKATIRLGQRAEIKRVETKYESLLLAETHFPKANEASVEVEDWARLVVANWRIFSSGEWTDTELGDGGKTAVSRGVLEILYRAATKSFHSTSILRHLFTVHAALGEFDLAMHAFESYLEIMEKGKARAEKTGTREIGFDDDDTAMLTAAEAVRVLCRYGDRENVERAVALTGTMQKWLAQKTARGEESHATNGNLSENGAAVSTHLPSLRPATLAAAYKAMGISQAYWAQLTYESEERSKLLTEASSLLVRAQQQDANSIEIAYALALVLAETRDISGAIEVIRDVIEPSEVAVTLNGDATSAAVVGRKRQLIPLWHLLALCLTAQDDFEAGSQMCKAAFKQFGDPTVLFGQPLETMLRDPEKAMPTTTGLHGLVDRMEGPEKESLLQIKMTDIVLLELTEGAEVAVDLAEELLGLYSRLFGNPGDPVSSVRPPRTAVSTAPSRLGGTLRSIAGSIGRTGRSRRGNDNDTLRQQSVVSTNDSLIALPLRDVSNGINGQSTAPPISVTEPEAHGAVAGKSHGHHLHLPHLHFPGHGHGGDANTDSRSASDVETSEPLNEKTSPARSQAGDAPVAGQPLSEIAHNHPPEQLPAPAAQDHEPPPRQDVRLPTAHPASQATAPEPHLLPLHERRHKFGVLIQIWLFIAGLYIRAEMYDDAQIAVQNATKFAEGLEVELAGSSSGVNARRLFHKGWGSGQSVDGLLADVWSMKAHLALARQHPFEAMASYEQALSHFPDHAASIIGISNLLLDIYEEKLPAEEPMPSQRPLPTASGSLISEAKPARPRTASSSSTIPSRRPSLINATPEPLDLKGTKQDPTPAQLNLLAARDRAYMLLSNLTKLGTGWDDSEAWLAFARAHELSGEVGKAKQALWWVVELEETRPVRGWREVMTGGYAL